MGLRQARRLVDELRIVGPRPAQFDGYPQRRLAPGNPFHPAHHLVSPPCELAPELRYQRLGALVIEAFEGAPRPGRDHPCDGRDADSHRQRNQDEQARAKCHGFSTSIQTSSRFHSPLLETPGCVQVLTLGLSEIGRASCRERVYTWLVACTVKAYTATAEVSQC